MEALNKILAERLFKVQDAQELNDGPSRPGVFGPHPDHVSATWVKHLYGLVDELNDMETEMIGMKLKDAIKLKEVPLVAERVILQKRYFLRMGCIDTYCNLVKNMIRNAEQLIEYGQRELID